MKREANLTAEMVANGAMATCSIGEGGSQEIVDTSVVVAILVAAHDITLTTSEASQLAADADRLLRAQSF